MGFSRQFTGGFEDVADARRFVGAALLALIATAGMSLAWFNRLP